MIDLRMVRLIEHRERELAQALITRLKSTARCSDLMKVPESELEARVFQIYRDLSGWIMDRSEAELEFIYRHLGRKRLDQGVRFDHLLWSFAIAKEHLWDFAVEEELASNEVDLYGQLETLRVVEQFFDGALYYLSVGYREALTFPKETAVA